MATRPIFSAALPSIGSLDAPKKPHVNKLVIVAFVVVIVLVTAFWLALRARGIV